MHAKSLERVVDQASHGLICDTASFRATSEHVKHCWENKWRKRLTQILEGAASQLSNNDGDLNENGKNAIGLDPVYMEVGDPRKVR